MSAKYKNMYLTLAAASVKTSSALVSLWNCSAVREEIHTLITRKWALLQAKKIAS